MKCAMCGKTIIGYWYTVAEKNICQSCGDTTTLYDLMMEKIIDLKPDVVEVENETGEVLNADELPAPSPLDAAVDIDEPSHVYTEKEAAGFLEIIRSIKEAGFDSEDAFMQKCNELFDNDDVDNPIIQLWEKYTNEAPWFGDEDPNDSWELMRNQWNVE